MTDPTPTADEIARWAELHVNEADGPWRDAGITEDRRWHLIDTGLDFPSVRCADDDEAELIVAAVNALPRLLALVAAQAEQNAELRGEVERLRKLGPRSSWVERINRAGEAYGELLAERDAARAELSALRATDEYQRWARAVTERDAAREQVARVAAVINDPARTWIIDTHNRDGTVEKRGREVVDSDDIRAALGAAT